MLLDDIPYEVHPLVGVEKREGRRGSVAHERRAKAGRLALSWLSVEADSHSKQLLVSVKPHTGWYVRLIVCA